MISSSVGDANPYRSSLTKNTVKNTGDSTNLKPPWKRGDPSPNPKGRPKLSPLTDASRAWLAEIDPRTGKTNAELCAAAVGKRARRGSVEAFRTLADRVEGKPKQSVALTAVADPWLDFEGWSVGELQDFAELGILPARFASGDGQENETESST